MWAKIKTLPILTCKLVHGCWSEEFNVMKEKISSLKFHNFFLSTLRCRTSQDCGVDPSILASGVMASDVHGWDWWEGWSIFISFLDLLNIVEVLQEHLNPSTLVQDVCLGWIGWMERHSSLSRSQSRLVVASRCNAGDSLYAAFQTRFYNRTFLPGCTIAKHIEPSARIINPGRQPRNINVETKSLIEESAVILILIYQSQREMWKLKIEKNTGYLWGC